MILRTVGCAAALLVGAIGPSQSQAVAALAPQVEHYQHLLSPTLAGLFAGVPAPIELPAELHRRFQKGMHSEA